MRTVAVLLAVLCAFAALPVANAADECFIDAARQQVCQRIDLTRPSTPPNVPAVPNTPYWDTYYLFIGAGACATAPTSNACGGVPPAPGSGVPLPDGSGAIGAGVFGVLWQETNNLAGLQRATASGKAADRMILI